MQATHLQLPERRAVHVNLLNKVTVSPLLVLGNLGKDPGNGRMLLQCPGILDARCSGGKLE